MIDIQSMIAMLNSSDDIQSEDIAFAKGRYNLALNWSDIKQQLKLRKNGYK